jgi:hypothetical protein
MVCASSHAAGCASDAEVASGAGGAGGGNGPAEGVSAAELPYEPCSDSNLVGAFEIELGRDFTRVGGKVFDGVEPSQVPRELAREGDCRLLSPPTLNCDPACAFSTETCAAENSCLPRPVARDLGTVTVQGMAIPLSLSPNTTTKNYANPATPRLPHPGFEPGADLVLSTAGGEYEPLALRGWGVSLLELTTDPVEVVPGMPTVLEWRAPLEPGPARVRANLNVNNHGSSSTSIECEFRDTGSGTIPAGLIDALLAEGRSGFPSLTIARRTATSTTIAPGCVELLVVSAIDSSVQVSGLVSCNSTVDCPKAQTCRPLERFCE